MWFIDKISEFIKNNPGDVYSVTEIYNGESRTEQFHPAPYTSDVYSVSKFVTMLGIGLLYDEGKLKVTDKIVDLIKDCPVPKEPKWNDVTVEDCLQHKTGLISGNLDVDSKDYDFTEDWLSYILALKIEGIRTVDYHYTDAAFYLLSCVITSLSGKSAYDFLRERIFVPLHFRECSWSTCPRGFNVGGSGFCVNDSDLAKLGQIFIQKGKYDGKRYFSEEWVELAFSKSYAIVERKEYPGFYYKTGAVGQILIMLPYENRVIAIRGYHGSDYRTKLIDELFSAEVTCEA